MDTATKEILWETTVAMGKIMAGIIAGLGLFFALVIELTDGPAVANGNGPLTCVVLDTHKRWIEAENKIDLLNLRVKCPDDHRNGLPFSPIDRWWPEFGMTAEAAAQLEVGAKLICVTTYRRGYLTNVYVPGAGGYRCQSA